MRVVDLIKNSTKTAFSFEILPPLKGNSIHKVYQVIDRLREFDPKYINITSHHSECVEKEEGNGTFSKVNVRKRPGSVAIASAIQHRYGIAAVPHIICKGFTKEETEYALIDLNFLGVYDLLLLRGDVKGARKESHPDKCHSYATDLQQQVNDFNRGVDLEKVVFEPFETPFSYGMACYPEKHEEAPNIDSDIYYAKEKVKQGAGYLVTQMFFNNAHYFSFVDRLRAEGVTVPIIPGIKPIVFKDQLTVLPRVFGTEIPEPLANTLRQCKDNQAVRQVGVEWTLQQCRELVAYGVPSLHFYTFMASESVYEVAKGLY